MNNIFYLLWFVLTLQTLVSILHLPHQHISMGTSHTSSSQSPHVARGHYPGPHRRRPSLCPLSSLRGPPGSGSGSWETASPWWLQDPSDPAHSRDTPGTRRLEPAHRCRTDCQAGFHGTCSYRGWVPDCPVLHTGPPLFPTLRFPGHFRCFVGSHQALSGGCWVSCLKERQQECTSCRSGLQAGWAFLGTF